MRARIVAVVDRRPERDVRAVGERGRAFDARADGDQVDRVGILDADRALRVADRDELERQALDLAVAVVGAGWIVLGRAQRRAAHVDAAAPIVEDRRADLAGDRADRELAPVGPAAAVQVHDRLARAVARQLGLRPVGVEDAQVGDESGLVGLAQQQDAVGADAEVAVAQRAHPIGAQRRASRRCSSDEVVVAQRLPLLEGDRGHAGPDSSSRRPPAATRVREVDELDAGQLAHPRQLAARVVARAALHRLDVAGEQVGEAQRLARGLRRARRRWRRGPRRSRRRRPSRRPARRCARTAHRAPSSRRAAGSGGACARSTAGWAAARRAAPARRDRRARAGARAGGRRWARRPRPPTARGGAARRAAPRAPSACSASVQRARISSGADGRRSSSASAARRYRPVPPTTIGVRPAASSPSISAWARRACSATEKRASTGTKETRRCSRRACSARLATPVSTSRPAYTCSASAEIATGSSPRPRRMSASAMASAVLPTPVGPKTARTVGASGMARSVGCRAMDVSGKTVLVTGATGGLGQAIARTFAGQGAEARPHRPPHRGARAAGRGAVGAGAGDRPGRARRRAAPDRRLGARSTC